MDVDQAVQALVSSVLSPTQAGPVPDSMSVTVTVDVEVDGVTVDTLRVGLVGLVAQVIEHGNRPQHPAQHQDRAPTRLVTAVGDVQTRDVIATVTRLFAHDPDDFA